MTAEVTPLSAVHDRVPTNVIEALALVIRDLPGIGKDQQASAAQGGYAYRGIEAITREVAPLFARHGVVFVPTGMHRYEPRELTINGKPWTDERVDVSYRAYGPGGPQDFIDIGPIPAIGRDNADKGANKCMTQAFKYALIQTLCIGDSKDDADGETHEADAALRQPTVPLAPNSEVAAFLELVRIAAEPVRDAMNQWWKVRGLRSDSLTLEQLNEAHAKFAEIASSDSQDSGAGGAGDREEPAAPTTPSDTSAPDPASGPSLEEEAFMDAARPCSRCGSNRTKRAIVGDHVRCIGVKECDARVAARENPCGVADCKKAATKDGLCPDHEAY